MSFTTMNLAIASPSRSAYSETFIHMQMELLPCVLRVYGGPVASETVPGGSIAPLKNLRGMAETLFDIGIRKLSWGGPQTRELARRLKRARVDTILVNYGPESVRMLPVVKSLGINLVAHFHGADAHSDDVIKKYGGSYRQLGRAASAVIAVSHSMVTSLVSQGIPKEKIHLLRYGVYPERFDGRKSVGLSAQFFGVGRFVDKKAPYLTLLAFTEVLEQFPEARLVLAGDGPLMECTRNLAIVLGVERSVNFPGVLTPDQVADEMSRSTAFVQHSLVPQYGPSAGDSEGTPVAVLEAMMTGVPVISTKHAGIQEVIRDGVSGFLINERDVSGMAKAMLRVLKEPELAREVGDTARRQALEEHTADAYISSLQRVLSSVHETLL